MKRICIFHRDETGGYQLSFAILLPFFTLLILFMVESSLALNAKIGTKYAAFAAARAAIVWVDAEELPEEARMGMVQLAAVNALAPFASSRHPPVSNEYFEFPAGAELAWAEAYHAKVGARHDASYLSKKWLYAASATRINVDLSDEEHNALVTVTVFYDHPFHTTGVARLLGGSLTAVATVTLPKEGIRRAGESSQIKFHDDYRFRANEVGA